MENEIMNMEVEEMDNNEVEVTYTDLPESEEPSGNAVVKGILFGAAAVAGVAALAWNSKWAKAKRAEWSDKRRAKQIAKLEKEGYLVSYPAECEPVVDENVDEIPSEGTEE